MVQVAVERGGFDGRFASPEKYVGYVVRDPLHKKIGKVHELFVNGSGEPEYVRVNLGVFGLRSILLPVEDVTANDELRTLVLQ